MRIKKRKKQIRRRVTATPSKPSQSPMRPAETDFWRHKPDPKTFLAYFGRLTSSYQRTIREKMAEGWECVLHGTKTAPFTIRRVTVGKATGAINAINAPRHHDTDCLINEQLTINEFESKMPLAIIRTKISQIKRACFKTHSVHHSRRLGSVRSEGFRD